MHKLRLSLLILLLSSNTAAAIELDLSGYLTLGVGRMANEGPTYLEYDTSYNYDMESKIGIQLDASITENLKITTQILARGNFVDPYDEYRPQIEWAFISYRFASAWQARLGRLRTPNYLFSDFRDVGYAIPWARAPVDMYSDTLAFLNNYDGMELGYNTKWREYDIEVIFSGGAYKKKNADNEAKASRTASLILSIGTDTSNVRFNHTEATLDLIPDQADALVREFNRVGEDFPVFNDLAKRGLITDERFIYDAIGYSYDDDEWLIHSEMYRIETDHDSALNYAAAYLSVGYQFNQLTPYIVYGTSLIEGGAPLKKKIDATFADDVLPRDTDIIADFARDQAISGTFRYRKQYTTAIGLRWDFFENVALKFEALEFAPKKDSCGALTCADGESRDAVLYTVAIDAIF